MDSQLAMVEQPFSTGSENHVCMRLGSLGAAEATGLLEGGHYHSLDTAGSCPGLCAHCYLLFAGKLQALSPRPLPLGAYLTAEIDAPLQGGPLRAIALVVRHYDGLRQGMHVSALRFLGVAKQGSAQPMAGAAL